MLSVLPGDFLNHKTTVWGAAFKAKRSEASCWVSTPQDYSLGRMIKRSGELNRGLEVQSYGEAISKSEEIQGAMLNLDSGLGGKVQNQASISKQIA